MPIRDHLDLVALLPYFKLSRREQRALDEFNSVYDAALENFKAQELARWNTQYPRFVATDSIIKHYEHIVIEGDLYPENQRRRFATAQPPIKPSSNFLNDYTKLGDHRKISLLPLTLPASLLALKSPRVIVLAFAPDGEKFYYYYNQYLNNAIKIHANQQALNNHSNAYFYEYLNQLDSEEFYRQVQCDPNDLPILYKQLIESLKDLNLEPSDLACTDGKPLEFISSLCIYNLLQATLITEDLDPLISQDSKKVILARTDHQALLNLAAKEGCYKAAIAINNIVAKKITNSSSILEAQQLYNNYQTQYENCFIEHFKAAGNFLTINLQLRLYTLITQLIPPGGCSHIMVLNEKAKVPHSIDKGIICIQITQEQLGEVNTYWSKDDILVHKSFNQFRFSPDLQALLQTPGKHSMERHLCQELVSITHYSLPHLGFEHFHSDAYQALLNMYIHLKMLDYFTAFYKNSLRLCFKTDYSDHKIQALFSQENKGKEPIMTVYDAIIYLKSLCPRLSNGELEHPKFSEIDRQLVDLKCYQIPIWSDDYSQLNNRMFRQQS